MKNSKFFAAIPAVLFSICFAGTIAAAETDGDVRGGNVKTTYFSEVHPSGTFRKDCSETKTPGLGGSKILDCQKYVREIGEDGNPTGPWINVPMGTVVEGKFSGKVVLSLTGTVPAAAVQTVGAIRAAKEMGCGDSCGTTINNSPAIGITNNMNANISVPCNGDCN